MSVKEVAAKAKKVKAEQSYQFVTFVLGGEHHAVKIEHVKEVAVTPKVSKMPRTPSFIKGVANVRGELIAIVDLEERFNMKPVLSLNSGLNSKTYTIVIDADTYTIGFTVNEVPNTLILTDSQIDRSADVVEKAKIRNRFIDGVGKAVGGDLIILLDILKVLSESEIRQISK